MEVGQMCHAVAVVRLLWDEEMGTWR